MKDPMKSRGGAPKKCSGDGGGMGWVMHRGGVG